MLPEGIRPGRALAKALLIASALAAAAPAAPRLRYLSFGPMFHWNFGNGRYLAFSYGFEAAWWSYAKQLPEQSIFRNMPEIEDPKRPGYGFALGVDVGRSGYRAYLEPEIGWALAGVSLGPVVEAASPDAPLRWGVQGSAWTNLLLGADFRYRRLGGQGTEAVGLYGKLVLPASDP